MASVFGHALWLGLTSFGGPIAHLGFFERRYVARLRWLTPEHFASLVSLCQLLPGPTSSQVGFLIGRVRAGWYGALAAWLGFTLPSALLMVAAVRLTPVLPVRVLQVLLQGLMLTAAVVVMQAVWSMAAALRTDWRRPVIALGAFALTCAGPSRVVLLATFAGGAAAGALWLRAPRAAPDGAEPRVGRVLTPLGLALLLGAGSAVWHGEPQGAWRLAAILYRAGALVFGGGHVVLPVLRESLVPSGWMSDAQFLAGYGFAQAVPGPLFSLAAYIGATCAPPAHVLAWALLSLASIFLPGLLLASAAFELLGCVSRYTLVAAMVSGMNAAVVGLLAGALCMTVVPASVHTIADIAVVSGALWLALRHGLSPAWVALLCVASRALLAVGGATLTA